MSPEAQQIAIAEARGWKFNGVTKFGRGCCPRRPGDMAYVGTMQVPLVDQWTPPENWDGFPGTPLPPDYLNDLNAMHEAEKVLTPEQLHRYNGLIQRVLSRDDMDEHWSPRKPESYTWHINSSQRAEAMVRAIEKWDDSK